MNKLTFFFSKLLHLLVVLGGFILFWQSIVWIFHIPNYYVATPAEVFSTLWHSRALLWQQSWPTMAEALLGLGCAIIWGIIVGTFLVLFRPFRYLFLPIVLASQAIPTLAVAPLFVLWFGFELNAKVLLVIFSLFFPISLALYEGVRTLPKAWMLQAELMQAKRWRKFLVIDFLGALPSLAAGVRMATAWAPLAAVASEWVGSARGLGFLMINASSGFNNNLLFSAIIILVCLSMGLYYSVDQILKKWVRW